MWPGKKKKRPFPVICYVQRHGYWYIDGPFVSCDGDLPWLPVFLSLQIGLPHFSWWKPSFLAEIRLSYIQICIYIYNYIHTYISMAIRSPEGTSTLTTYIIAYPFFSGIIKNIKNPRAFGNRPPPACTWWNSQSDPIDPGIHIPRVDDAPKHTKMNSTSLTWRYLLQDTLAQTRTYPVECCFHWRKSLYLTQSKTM